MVLTRYIFATASLVHAISATTTRSPPGKTENDEIYQAMTIDSSKRNRFTGNYGDRLDKPKLFNFVKESCQCNDTVEGSWTKLLQFNAIVFQDFTTFGSQDILGRLAVGGNLDTPNFLVNANSGQQCYGTNTVPWDELALAVGGNILTPDVKVHGHWWTAGSGSAVELNAECNSPATPDTAFPFSDVQEDLNNYSQQYAAVSPNLVINEDSSITVLGTQSSGCEDSITLWPCYNNSLTTCIKRDNWSVPDHILLGQPNWNGPSNGYPGLDKLLIINVPGQSCSLLWNFYPIDEYGNFLNTGSFKLIRNTGSPFKGVVLAPRADIIDGSSGVFEGTVFANSYKWQMTNGVEIHNTPSCAGYHYCLPGVGGGGGLPQGSGSVAEPSPSISELPVLPAPTDEVTSTSTESNGATSSIRSTEAITPFLSVIETPGPTPSSSENGSKTCEHHHHHHGDEHDSYHKHGDHDSHGSHNHHKHGDNDDHGDQDDSHDSHDSHKHGDNDDHGDYDDDWHNGHNGEHWQDDECANDDGYYHDDDDHNHRD